MTRIFVSKIESLIEGPIKEVQLGSTQGFGAYSHLFCPESATHPAKANLNLLRYIIQNYSEPGDVVVDMMAGTGSTGIVACLEGRKTVLVDCEEKFVGWIQKNMARLKAYDPSAVIEVMQGDSRELSQLVNGGPDSIVTSPPFASEGYVEEKVGYFDAIGGIGHDDYAKYGRGNIADLKLPWYKTFRLGRRWRGFGQYLRECRLAKGLTQRQCMKLVWGKVYNGGGVIWFETGKKVPTDDEYQKLKEILELDDRYDSEEGIDAIITSPPYGDDNFRAKLSESQIWQDLKPSLSTRSAQGRMSEDPKNIDNARKMYGYRTVGGIGGGNGETYLEAMYLVYEESFKVLKPNGFLVLILKPFRSNRTIVDLPYDTHLLVSSVGFNLVDVLKSRLSQRSFWSNIHRKKFPSATEMAHEFVLVYRKPDGVGLAVEEEPTLDQGPEFDVPWWMMPEDKASQVSLEACEQE